MTIASLQQKHIAELQEIAQDLGVTDFAEMPKHDLVYRILEANAEASTVDSDATLDENDGQGSSHTAQNGQKLPSSKRLPAYMLDFDPKKVALDGMIRKVGLLEVLPDGYGFLRSRDFGYNPSADDIYVSPSQIKRFSLRVGDLVEGEIRPPREGQRFFALIQVSAINGRSPESFGQRTGFEFLTPRHSDTALRLETTPEAHAPRILDLFCPIGMGHRCLVVAPQGSGGTTLLQQIAHATQQNLPNAQVVALLINGLRDDILDFEKYTGAHVVATTLGDTAERHTHAAALAGEMMRRGVEAGHDVVLLVDSLTELVRAEGELAREEAASEKELDAGNLMSKARALLGAAKAVEGGGSLTVIATTQKDSVDGLEEAVFQELKGTSNSTIVLSNDLANKRIFPAIDLQRSHTRRDEMLIPTDQLALIQEFRRQLHRLEPADAMLQLLEKLGASLTNSELVASIADS